MLLFKNPAHHRVYNTVLVLFECLIPQFHGFHMICCCFLKSNLQNIYRAGVYKSSDEGNFLQNYTNSIYVVIKCIPTYYLQKQRTLLNKMQLSQRQEHGKCPRISPTHKELSLDATGLHILDTCILHEEHKLVK